MTEEAEGKAILGLRGKLGSEEEDNHDDDDGFVVVGEHRGLLLQQRQTRFLRHSNHLSLNDKHFKKRTAHL